jgi:hypothetical protein
MKNLTIILVAVFLSLGGYAQQVTANAKVNAAYSQEELSAKSSEEIQYLNFLSESLCTVNDLGEKAASYPAFSFLDKNGNAINPENNFNPLLFPALEAQGEFQYYRIEGTNFVVFVQSITRLQVLYQRFLANQNN